MMTLNPSFSLPIRFAHGTGTSFNSTNVVPDGQTPWHSIRLVLSCGQRSMSNMLTPFAPAPPVRTAVVKKSAQIPFVIHFFSPDTM
jgi:hypothetical protein